MQGEYVGMRVKNIEDMSTRASWSVIYISSLWEREWTRGI
jgi:hypothetical protein